MSFRKTNLDQMKTIWELAPLNRFFPEGDPRRIIKGEPGVREFITQDGNRIFTRTEPEHGKPDRG